MREVDMKRFEGRVVIVTGGARGIGKACVERFAAEGARVAVLDLDQQAAQELAQTCGGIGIYCNVADHASVHEAFNQVVEQWGRIDALVANAGVYRSAPLDSDFLADWQLVIDVDLTGTMLCCHAVAPVMKDQQAGSIVIMSSMAGKTSWAETAAYSSAKTGVLGLARSVAMELGPFNINCNAICLGHADTEMMRAVDESVCHNNGWEQGTYLRQLADSNPMRRLGSVEETAGLAAYLASDEARYINGQSIEIDGGRIMS
jgi:NAD(P)-dependent dehydrogenase (short-subunit alcohol dehydrogenase family)